LNPKPILGIDIGSTKIAAAIAQKSDEKFALAGFGEVRSQGLKKGVITNIELASKSIKNAYDQATRIAGLTPSKAIVSISGAYTKSICSHGLVNIPNQEITISEINRVIQTALYNANIPYEYEILHVLPYKFRVDEQDFIEDPYGMNASRLEVDVHIITAPKSALFNLKKAVKEAGIEIENIVLAGYASAIATLSPEEKEAGSCVIDMGGYTCNMVVHVGNSIVYNDFLAVGSAHITNDLSLALHTPTSVAEEIKIRYGDLSAPQSDYIEIPVIGDEETLNQVSLEIVYNVIYARVEETLMILANSLEKSGLKEQIGGGVVLTGGMTKLQGLRELAVAIFDHMPVRIGKPKKIDSEIADTLEDPKYATLVGLLLYGIAEGTPYEIDSNKKLRYKNEFIELGSSSLNNLTLTKEPAQPSPQEPEEELLETFEGQLEFKEERLTIKERISKMIQWFTQLF